MRPRRRGRLWPLALLLVAGCGGGSGGGPAFGLDRRVEVAPLPLPDGLPDPSPAELEVAFPALVFDQPILLAAPPDGSGRVVVVEQPGRVHVFANDVATTSTRVFLDLTATTQFGGEEGLLGFAFHPQYQANGWCYVYRTRGAPRRSVLSRFTVSGDPDALDPGSEVVLLEFEQPFANHNAGSLAFGPDGRLYVASGDGGNANDPFDHAQSLGTLLGKILRLEPDGSVPADNPFVGTPGARGEIWAYGLRNPWRMSFDPATGDLWVGDVGQGAREEVDLVTRGANLGWPVFEGTRSNKNPTGLPPGAFTPPVHDYGRTDGASVTGGHVYRGSAVPALVGAYVYADFVSGNVWGLVHDGVQAVANVWLATTSGPASFGEDAAGELYVCCFDGRIRRFRAAGGGGAATAMPALLSQTGLFADTAALSPAPGVLEYGVQAPSWADGARRRRWLALPGPARIAFAATGAWSFPIGTVLVKHFELATAASPATQVETRVLLHQRDGWRGYTYRWNDAGSDAELVDAAGGDATFALPGGAGAGQQLWRLPSRAQCLACHTAAAGHVLGVRTAQLNGDFPFPLRTDNQLRAWNHIGLFTSDVGGPSAYAAMRDPYDTAAPRDDRARAWLDTNCAHCHRPQGPTPVDLDLRVEVAGADLRLFGVPAAVAAPGGVGQRAVVGAPAHSDVWLRAGRRDGFGMPPLASTVVDAVGLDLLAEWLVAGPAR